MFLILFLAACTSSGLGLEAVRSSDSASFGRGGEATLSGEWDSWWYTNVFVPEGAESFSVTIEGGEGNADLYVLPSSGWTTPSLGDVACGPTSADMDPASTPSDAETCTLETPESGLYVIGVYGSEAFANVQLHWSGAQSTMEIDALDNDVLAAFAAAGESRDFMFFAPLGATGMEVRARTIDAEHRGELEMTVTGIAGEEPCVVTSEGRLASCSIPIAPGSDPMAANPLVMGRLDYLTATPWVEVTATVTLNDFGYPPADSGLVETEDVVEDIVDDVAEEDLVFSQGMIDVLEGESIEMTFTLDEPASTLRMSTLGTGGAQVRLQHTEGAFCQWLPDAHEAPECIIEIAPAGEYTLYVAPWSDIETLEVTVWAAR